MSIADKLTYLQTTKQLLKTEINKINNVLDDNSTFRSYPQELFNGYLDILNNGTDTLWSNLEKVSQTGTEAVLENVETAPLKMVLNGNTSQETTTGKNLFDQTTNQLLNVSRITWGTNISQIVDLLNSLNEGQYALSYKVKFDSLDSQTSGERIIGFIITNSVSGNINTRRNETVRINEIYNVEGIITITASNKGSFTNCYLYSRSSTSSTADYSTTYDVQLEQGSATSYEPYTGGQPSPNPDYPQQVKVVKGENVVSVSGKNCLVPFVFNRTNNGIEFNYNADGSITINGTSTGTAYAIATSSVPLFTKLKAGTYTLSTTGNIAIRLDDSNGVNIVNTTTSTTFTLTEDKEVYIQIRIGSGTTIINQTIYPMIEQNSQATPYVPYSKTDYPINLGTLELCKINTYKDYFHKDNGKWYVHKEIGKYFYNDDLTTNGITADRVDFLTPVLNVQPSLSSIANIAFCNMMSANSINRTGLNGTTSTSKIRIGVSTNYGTTYDEIKNIFANFNLTIYYGLATPTEEEITNTTLIEQLEAIFKAKSVKDKTYITQTNDELPFILDVEAIKEYEVN